MGSDSPAFARATSPAFEGEAGLRRVIDEAGVATWDTDLVARESIWSANHFRLFG